MKLHMKLIALLLLLVMGLQTVLTACAPAQNPDATGGLNQNVTAEETDPSHASDSPAGDLFDNERAQRLKILRSELKLSQEDVLSKIKAQHLVENGGYEDEDEVILLVTMPGDSLIDRYLADACTRYHSVAEYAASEEGRAYTEELLAGQDELIGELRGADLIVDAGYRYTTILNGFSVGTRWKNVSKIGSRTSVQSTVLSETYNRPQAASGADASAIVNDVQVYPTGIFDSGSVSFTGVGTAVAVLDSGFDCSHEVFATQPQFPDKLLLTQPLISSLLPESRAYGFDSSLELMDVWYSNKIPFAFDYADKDKDVFPYDSEHGTHVSGIIGGSSATIHGVAVDTQLVLMKVFPDLDDGAKTENILAALEDAVLLGVDAINMSLGSSCGFSREVDDSAINKVYDKIGKSGISLLTAASNSFSSAFGGAQGNTGFVTNPDNATVGSPSTYAAALSVASISGTKSDYLYANNSNVIFFNESNSVTGEPNHFMDELTASLKRLGLWDGVGTYEVEYVTIPGVGMKANYSGVGDLTGKIVLVRRGDTTFEDKALRAKNAGAVACIIYNNIDGDILMSMGKTDHIPTISISKDNGTILASRERGTIVISSEYKAGPFMSDFSSWGPNPDLTLKPEITAHGGNILSAIPGYKLENGKIVYNYDELSGTSMATPNLCGIVVLIRQFLKEKYTDFSAQAINTLCNQMLMSTAGIILDEQGNPYSPRKQGAGLASLYNVVNTRAYITTLDRDGNQMERSKLELFDDPQKTGVYTMRFRVVNLSDAPISFKPGVIGMTESVSTSDSKHIAEKDQILGGSYVMSVEEGGTYVDGILTVPAGTTASVTAVYTLTDADKELIENLFPNGMYVEGFVTLEAVEESDIDLNVPFLAFFGDWTVAPMFDKTYYEVESEAHNAAIDEEDKLKADYFATTPYGSYYYNYIIPLGTYLYDVDESKYDVIPATEEHIAVSNILGTIDGISAVYAGLLRNAKKMTYTITDKVTGEEIYKKVVDNANKAYSLGGSPIPNYEYLRIRFKDYGDQLVNNRQYEFNMTGLLDYGDGGADNNVRNSFTFDFCLDDEAPVLRSATYEKVYDKTLKKDRYYVDLVVYDNQYVQSITPIIFTSSSSYTFLTDNPIPVYSERGAENKVRFEITDLLDDIYYSDIISSALAFSIDDYALNSNIYLCQLPGTKGDFSFTKNGEAGGEALQILTVEEGSVIDLSQYLVTGDRSVDKDRDYMRYLIWTSSNENVALVKEGQLKAIAAGATTVTVSEAMDLKNAVLLVRVKPKATADSAEGGDDSSKKGIRRPVRSDLSDYAEEPIEKIRFSYFDTVFAYSRAAQTSEIGTTGSRTYIHSLPAGGVGFYPGEKIKLHYDIEPWYVDDHYKFTFTTDNPDIASVTEDGEVTALSEGVAIITVSVEGSYLSDNLTVTVKNPFVIEDRTLIAYKGLGGDVVIPDDEGILYIGAYAFCLYTTDMSVELPEDDFDANKIPATNTAITSITVPHGVTEIRKYAFYNCTSLRQVIIPDTVKFIREFAFTGDVKLEYVNLDRVEAIGRAAFKDCTKFGSDPERPICISTTYSLGESAFENCTSLPYMDLTALRNSGNRIFFGCTGLKSVSMNENTKLSAFMFTKAGLERADIYATWQIPAYCFYGCDRMTEVVFHNGLSLIGDYAFAMCDSLQTLTLPDSSVIFGSYCFYFTYAKSVPAAERHKGLTTLIFGEHSQILQAGGPLFEGTNLSVFRVSDQNPYYRASEDGHTLFSKDGSTLVLASVAIAYGDYTLPAGCTAVGDSAFAAADIRSIRFPEGVKVGAYAFMNCVGLEKIEFAASGETELGKYAFAYDTALYLVTGLESVKLADECAFTYTGNFGSAADENKVPTAPAVIGDGAKLDAAVFYGSSIQFITIGAGVTFGNNAFRECKKLVTVNMPSAGGVVFGNTAFGNDVALKTIDLSQLTAIPDEAFFGCTSLTSADLQNAVTIGNYAFNSCESLRTLNMPRVESIGEFAFGYYKGGAAPVFNTINGGEAGVVIFPETLKTIGSGAFFACNGIRKAVLTGVEKLEGYAFTYCANLAEVVLPDSVTEIKDHTFYGCEALATINLGKVKNVGLDAFAKCTALKTVDLTSMEVLGEEAFASTGVTGNLVANNLTEVGVAAFYLADLHGLEARKLAVIGANAFRENANMTDFVFSAELKSIGTQAFYGCPKIERFRFFAGEGTEQDGKINEFAMLRNGVLYTVLASGSLQLTAVPGGMNETVLEVPEGTVRVDEYAGNANKFITKVILPDSMKRIGNFAFYGYDLLDTVEFRSVIAPDLEDSYNRDTFEGQITEEDPGYDLLHNQFNLFNYELYYFTFIDMVGKKAPIKMILPANADVFGYDSLVYQVYFGTVADAERSTYTAMERAMMNFIAYAEKIAAIRKVSLTDETLINNALSAYNAIKQDPSAYGYDGETWNEMIGTVNKAKKELASLKLKNASKDIQDLQKTIDALPDAFDASMREMADALIAEVNGLTFANRALLDLTRYQTFVSSYNAFTAAEEKKTVASLQQRIDALPDAYNDASFAEYTALAAEIEAGGEALRKKLNLNRFDAYTQSYEVHLSRVRSARAVQEQIDALPEQYSADSYEAFRAVEASIAALSEEEKALLNLEKFEAYKASFEQEADNEDSAPVVIIVIVSVAVVLAAAAVVCIVLLKKRRMRGAQ